MIPIPNGQIILPESLKFGLDSVANGRISVGKGKVKALTEKEVQNHNFYEAVDVKYLRSRKYSPHREFDQAKRERIESILGRHINKDPRFDDRKLRFDSEIILSSNPSMIRLYFGPSHFLEHLATNNRCLQDPVFYARLVREGMISYNDPYAYLANNLAMNVVLKAGDNKYLLGLRSKTQRFFPETWHNIGGFYEAGDFSLFDKGDDGKAVLKSFEDRIVKEMEEEAAISQKEISNLRLIGLTFGLSSVDLNYEAEVQADSSHIINKGHFKGEDKDEHSGFISVTFGELVDVLEGKKCLEIKDGVVPAGSRPPTKIVPLGLGGLLVHVGLQDRDALNQIIKAPQYLFSF